MTIFYGTNSGITEVQTKNMKKIDRLKIASKKNKFLYFRISICFAVGSWLTVRELMNVTNSNNLTSLTLKNIQIISAGFMGIFCVVFFGLFLYGLLGDRTNQNNL